jgi:hypothetical protein
MQTYMAWAAPLLTIVIGLLVGYLAGYTKKRGENKAMHDDLDKLVDQVRAVTTTTKEIEAQISGGLWDRQRRWELKREVLFDATRRVAETEERLLSLNSMVQLEINKPEQLQPGWQQLRAEASVNWSKASAAIDESKLFISVSCGKETAQCFENYVQFTNSVAAKLGEKQVNVYLDSYRELLERRSAVRIAMRKELGIEAIS